VRHQSVFCGHASARRLLEASPRLLKLADEIAARQTARVEAALTIG
jgi:hypothetical protein